jgi:GDP-L-fucose synthase
MENYSEEEFINVGLGTELSIRELSELVAEVVGYQGKLDWDTSKPDGTQRKLMDGSRLEAMGWKPKTKLREGITAAYVEFQEKYA